MFWSKYEEYRSRINDYIREFLSKLSIPSNLRDASSHLILSGGKRIRPILVLSVVDLLGGEADHGLSVATAIEFLHNFTLIHDDIMDQDMYRRGVKTTHILYGVSTAILAGDYLYSLVFSLVSNYYKGDEARMLTQLLAHASENICIGQAMDIEPEKYIANVDDYIKMVYLKTASLIEASTASGSVVAGYPDLLDRFRELGRSIGIAFQVADDILGLVGDPSKTGKPVGNDIRNGKRTLPTLYILDKLDKDEYKFFMSVFGSGDADDASVREAIKIIERYGGIEYARKFMKRYSDMALNTIDLFEGSDAKDFLIYLIKYIVSRDR